MSGFWARAAKHMTDSLLLRDGRGEAPAAYRRLAMARLLWRMQRHRGVMPSFGGLDRVYVGR